MAASPKTRRGVIIPNQSSYYKPIAHFPSNYNFDQYYQWFNFILRNELPLR